MSRKVFQNNPIEKIIIDTFYPKKQEHPMGVLVFWWTHTSTTNKK
ncbi:MAG: hypothetical protein PUF80_07260 [Firmicutes bacterium]|nr:hypothetical protein [Bacillota bacterium]